MESYRRIDFSKNNVSACTACGVLDLQLSRRWTLMTANDGGRMGVDNEALMETVLHDLQISTGR